MKGVREVGMCIYIKQERPERNSFEESFLSTDFIFIESKRIQQHATYGFSFPLKD